MGGLPYDYLLSRYIDLVDDVTYEVPDGCSTLAAGILVAHTHPPGELNPSKQDLDLTIRLMDVGKLKDIELIDHLIITLDSNLSMSEDDLI